MRLLALLLSLVMGCHATVASDYHLSAEGNDETGDGSLDHPWLSIDNINSLNLEPGDRVLFHAGDTFVGNIQLGPEDTGTDEQGKLIKPITFTTYGAKDKHDRAIIKVPEGHGLEAHNNGGFDISNLVFIGDGKLGTENANAMLFWYDDAVGTTRHEHFHIDNVDASGFGRWGAKFRGEVPKKSGLGGYHDIRITNCEMHGNGFGGVQVNSKDWQNHAHEDIYIGYSRFHHNPPEHLPEEVHNGGNGVIIAQSRNVLIEHCVAHDNGHFGGFGFWCWVADNLTIQFCESYNNRSLTLDGGGFDLDGGTTNSVVQYCYSHDNNGAGLGLFQFHDAPPMQNNVFRYNISVNDARNPKYGAITVWAAKAENPASDCVFRNNTVVVSSTDKGLPAAVRFHSDYFDNIRIENNILMAIDDVPLIRNAGDRATFFNNLYWTGDGGFDVRFNKQVYTSLQAWREATGQERLDGRDIGLYADPKLIAPFQGGVICDTNRLVELKAYHLQPDSPAIDAALSPIELDQPEHDEMQNARDFYGNPVPQGEKPDIGAYEWTGE